jgi:hypothetical protein
MPLSSSLLPHAAKAHAFNGITAAMLAFGFLKFLSNLFNKTSFEMLTLFSNESASKLN